MKIKFYQCFSPKLSKYLIANGIEHTPEYVHKDTAATVRVFFFDDEGKLSKCLKEWTDKTNLD